MSPRPSPTPICHSLFAGEIQPRALVNVPRIMGEGLVGDYIANAITSESQILFDFSLRSLPLREHRRGQGSRRKPLRGEGESPMSHNVARHSYCSTALLHLSHGIAASQWICRAPARDAGKASSYQHSTISNFRFATPPALFLQSEFSRFIILYSKCLISVYAPTVCSVIVSGSVLRFLQ